MDFLTRTTTLSGLTVAAAIACGAGALGCDSSSTNAPQPGDDAFISENPRGGSSPNEGEPEDGGTTGTGGNPAPPATDDNDPERAITEADIIQVHGGKLYALSQFSGLSVIDVSVQDKLTLIGRYPVTGVPFEMYLRDGVIYAMFSSWGEYLYNQVAGTYIWEQTSRIEALDVSNPASIHPIGSFNLPGVISDSRVVGDVLYAVTYENGYCWNCAESPNTTVTSLNVADPEDIAVVDQLSYADNDPYGYGWRRSVTVTPERMYVAGIEWNGSSEGHSTIQVIDISDPGGLLIEGASVEATGQIQSRWQMDEHEGVLRVISQPGVWWSDAMPAVQTFTVASSQELSPLGFTEIALPEPETLRSVRFDGARAYAITAEQQDPLFTIDLSNPAAPAVLGELVMPGWVYHMEPRGDRLLALGFDNADPQGALNVSLFDVSDLTHPTMIKRVGFGGDWSSVAEDQDRIHKAFRIFDDQGLIVVPYSGWENDGSGEGCGSYKSGIQLVDFTADSLTRRGVAPARGQARRAFLNGDRLFAVSDEEVRTFNITNRSAPVKSSELALATVVNKSAVVGDVVVRLSADWWTTDARIEVVPATDPGRAEPLGVLDLQQLFPQGGCYGWGLWDARLFANGQHVYMTFPSNDWTKTRIAAIDLTNPQSPALAGQIEVAAHSYDPWGWYGAPVVDSGDMIVQSGSTLVLRRVETDGYYDPYAPTVMSRAWLEVVDLSNPAQPAHTATLELPEAAGHTALRADGTTVMTSHWVPLPEDDTKARFYFDRIDVSNPASPVLRAPVNVPGSLLSFDSDASRLLTVDYQRVTLSGVHGQECWDTFGWDATFEPSDPNDYESPGECRGMRRAFKLVDVQGSRASLRASSPIDDGTSFSTVMVGDDRVFAIGNNSMWYEDGGPSWSGSKILVAGGIHDGNLEVTSATGEQLGYSYPMAADGERLIFSGWGPPTISVLDASDLGDLVFEPMGELSGYAYAVTVDGDRALCSLGQYGLQVVDLAP